jgi:hypothetical protein
MPNRQKIKILWLLRKLGILLGLHSLRCKIFLATNFDQKGTFWWFLWYHSVSMSLVCELPWKWNSSCSEPSTTKSRYIEGMGTGDVHKKFGKKFGSLVCIWCVVVLSQSILK